MAIFDYAPKAALALKILTKYGQAVTLRRYGAAVYNPATQTSTPTVTDYARIGLVDDYKFQIAGEMLQNGTLAAAGDRQLWLNSGTVKPIASDHITFANGEIWTIANVKTVDPGGVAVIYECRIRQ